MKKPEYERLKLLGEGSFGQAFLVKRLDDKRLFVLKQMDLKSMSSKEKAETEKEALILSKLSHPNIVKFVEVYKRED